MDTNKTNSINLDDVRAKLSEGDKGYWKGFEEVVATEEYERWLGDEFPERSSIPDVDRRSFLKFAGLSLAALGLTGCRMLTQEKIVPYVKTPEDMVPGKPLYFATAFSHNGYANGVLVECYDGRPSRVEGNPDHPASLGSADSFSIASILHLYDPDRQVPLTEMALPSTWDSFFKQARKTLMESKKPGSVRILTETVTSPVLSAQIKGFLASHPGSQWHQWQSVNRDNVMLGSKLAFGALAEPVYHFEKASRIVSIDADFLSSMPGSVRYARDFATTRSLEDVDAISRVYAFQSTPNLVGAAADHTWAVKPSQMESVVYALANRLGVQAPQVTITGVPEAVLDTIARDILASPTTSVVVPADYLSASAHAACNAINKILGSTAVEFHAPVAQSPVSHLDSIAGLVNDINGGQVDVLLIIGGNPAYDAPADLKFADALSKVRNTWRLGLYRDETSKLCRWHLPEAHYMEAWGDAVAYDGTVSIVQPMIEPLFDGKSGIEVLSALANKPASGLEIVKAMYAKAGEKAWRETLNKGVVPNSGETALVVSANLGVLEEPVVASGIEAVFPPDPTIFDGRYANNGWLQELPKPLTKLTWDNAVHMSPKTAEQIGVKSEERVKVSAGDNSVVAPVWIQPGHADGVITLHLGYGRTNGGKVSDGTGTNFGVLRSAVGLGYLVGVQVEKQPGKYPLASSQMHHSMEGRDIIRVGSVSDYKASPSLIPASEEEAENPLTEPYYNLTEEWAEDKAYDQWGMAIDLNTCIGCNACVTACQTENNISTVGKIEVMRGRELHWLRIDRYYKVSDGAKSRDVEADGFANPHGSHSEDHGGPEDILDSNRIETVFQPIACMHCEVAPCEPVCPVAATVHSHEGLNQMVYNRCVGTRYCSNNCPYKVRRFNYHNYQFGQSEQVGNKPYGQRNFVGEKDIPLLRMIHNPNVTVRSRGVMEKCTYCVQRINQARIDAKKESRNIRDGDIVTACQQACPTQAITFGNIANPKSAVSQKKADKRNYGLLKHLNTVPRTSYLGKVRNPNPEVTA